MYWNAHCLLLLYLYAANKASFRRDIQPEAPPEGLAVGNVKWDARAELVVCDVTAGDIQGGVYRLTITQPVEKANDPVYIYLL